MDKGAVIKIIDRFRQKIETRGVTAQKIILYGSHASGTSAAVSDIDVVVISDDFAGKSYWERIDILTDVIYEMSMPIEAVAMTSEEWERGDSFIADFARHGEEKKRRGHISICELIFVQKQCIRQINPIFTGRARRAMVFCESWRSISPPQEEPWHKNPTFVSRNRRKNAATGTST